MSNLLFIRHAETDMAGTFCGHSDPPINKRGHEQLSELIMELHNSPIDTIISSDLQRAASTAKAIATAFNVPLSLSPNLREISFGDWEGLTWTEIESSDSAYAKLWVSRYPHLTAPGGEAFTLFQTRVLNEVDILSRHPGNQCIAVVTHAGVMRIVLQTLCNLDEQAAWDRTKQYCSFFLYIPGLGIHPEHRATKKKGDA